MKSAKIETIELKDIKYLLNELMPSINFELFKDTNQPEAIVINCCNEYERKYCKNDSNMNLFYWAVLTNRIEIAKVFWIRGKVIQNNMQTMLNFF